MHNNRVYEDIFGSDIDDQLEVMKMIFYKLERRKDYLALSGKEYPADPRGNASVSSLGIQKAKRKMRKYKQNNSKQNRNNKRGL